MPASRPLLSTVRLIRSGFSSTCLCVSLEPTVVTMPSPTRAMMVSSPAPPTRRSMLVRTVTRALARSSMPSLAMAATTGVSITLGVTLICTACSTSRPARSMADAFSKGISILERWAAMSALITRSTLPPASKCVSSLDRVTSSPALRALMSGSTRRLGWMRRSRMPTRELMLTCTPAASEVIHRPSGTKRRNTTTRMSATRMARPIHSSVLTGSDTSSM